MTTPQTPVEALMALEREKFEAHAVKNWCHKEDLKRGRLTGYIEPELNQAWRGWSARALAAIPAGSGESKFIGMACKACGRGEYFLDGNGYNNFPRCDRCDSVPSLQDYMDATAPTQPTAPAQDAQGVKCRDLSDEDVDEIINAIADLGNGEFGHHEFCDRIIEIAALRASSPAEPTINLKGHEFKPSDLLRRGVLNLRKGRSEFFWAVVSKSFGLGSTCSAALAAWAGRDPDTGIVTKEIT